MSFYFINKLKVFQVICQQHQDTIFNYTNEEVLFNDLNFFQFQGHINLESLGKKGYKIPKCGTVQVVSNIE